MKIKKSGSCFEYMWEGYYFVETGILWNKIILSISIDCVRLCKHLQKAQKCFLFEKKFDCVLQVFTHSNTNYKNELCSKYDLLVIKCRSSFDIEEQRSDARMLSKPECLYQKDCYISSDKYHCSDQYITAHNVFE